MGAPKIVDVDVGYTGGTKKKPSYRSMGDHTEATRVFYDSDHITFAELVDIFFDSHSGSSRSCQYRSAVWYTTDEEKAIAEATRDTHNRSSTAIEPLGEYTLAEDYHQNYFGKSKSKSR